MRNLFVAFSSCAVLLSAVNANAQETLLATTQIAPDCELSTSGSNTGALVFTEAGSNITRSFEIDCNTYFRVDVDVDQGVDHTGNVAGANTGKVVLSPANTVGGGFAQTLQSNISSTLDIGSGFIFGQPGQSLDPTDNNGKSVFTLSFSKPTDLSTAMGGISYTGAVTILINPDTSVPVS